MREALSSSLSQGVYVGLLALNVAVLIGLVTVDHLLAGDSVALHLLTVLGTLSIMALVITGFSNPPRRTDGSRSAFDLLEEAQVAKQAAQSASHAKSRYLASVSHEIRSPLNAIYGYAQLVERDDGVNARDAAKVIRRCAEHLSSLVDGLLDISQVEKGMLRLKLDVIELVPFLEQIVSIVRPSAAAKGLAFEYVTEGRLPHFVRTDPSRMRQVLINLLANAIKFTDRGSVTFRLVYRAQIARFEISDTGAGIALEDQERVFNPFERGVDEARPGIGLGLPIARALAEILGGSLELDSEPGRGTTFTITVMLSEVTGKLEHRTAGRHVSGYTGPRRSVLIAEDDPEQLAFIQHLLLSLGFEVIAASDGEQAIAAMEGRTFDLAILDISMPGMSGWQVAVRLRQQQAPELRILMLSGNSQEFHRPDFPVPVHDLFLVKPVEFDQLIDAIGGLLNLSWTQADPQPLAYLAPSGSGLDLNDAARDHLARLGEFLRVGYARGIEEEIHQLAQADARAEPLAAELIEALDRFDLTAMAKILEDA